MRSIHPQWDSLCLSVLPSHRYTCRVHQRCLFWLRWLFLRGWMGEGSEEWGDLGSVWTCGLLQLPAALLLSTLNISWSNNLWYVNGQQGQCLLMCINTAAWWHGFAQSTGSRLMFASTCPSPLAYLSSFRKTQDTWDGGSVCSYRAISLDRVIARNHGVHMSYSFYILASSIKPQVMKNIDPL